MNEKIGMYTEDEILEHLTEGEGREFLGRSMYDAIFDKIHALKTENEQLQQENKQLKDLLDKLFSRITLWKMDDITMDANRILDDLLKTFKGE